ncbi:vasodilator-stimulated phosphoprotein-like isoform X1 [Labrus mixtus]|uniref:vasodilator-stimulated phosphoprotein-like isoform X1 n=1 Tax=Labrus mixtus TaxID=508554 RepID=UPI0029BFAC84|nr:vasodilator-stimulated phosphoprotein-like isoform X1 [Labrus mixtus]
MSESNICQVRATVMLYDDTNKRWVPAGSDSPAFSRVQIFHNPVANTYRVVGRKLQADQQVVINCPIIKGMKYNQATPNFHQWRDPKQVWGLNFGSKEDAALFAHSMMQALEALSVQDDSAQRGASAQELEQNRRLERQRQEQQEKDSLEEERQASVAKPVPAAAPSAPSAAQLAPPPPPGPPCPPAPAPPPPPPPPPSWSNVPPAPSPPSAQTSGGSSGVGGGGGNNLAAALAGAKLRKTVTGEGGEATQDPKPPLASGGGGAGNLMGEMSAILARRKKAADDPAAKKAEHKEDSNCSKSKFSGAGEIQGKAQEHSASTQRPKHFPNNQRDSTHKPPNASVSRIKVSKKGSEGEGSDIDMEQFKQEIVEEMKRELQKVKDEIIMALLQELRSSQQE